MNKIGEKAIKTYRCASEATGKIARQIKLKAQMADNKSKIKEIYEEIGKKVYEGHRLQEKLDIDTNFIEECNVIDALANEIEDIRIEILSLKHMQQCPNCYYEIDLEFHYCPNCGQEQNLSEKVKQNDGVATIETTNEVDKKLRKTKTNDSMNNELKNSILDENDFEDTIKDDEE